MYRAERYRQEWLSGTWFEWVWGAITVGAMFVMLLLGASETAKYTTWAEFLQGFGALLSVAVSCQAAQHAVIRSFGARPEFKWFRFTQRSALNSVWIAEDHRFPREQFAAVCLRPLFAALVVAVLCLLVVPAEWWLVVALLGYLLTEARRVWFHVQILHQPGDTLFEERAEGSRIHLPT